MWKWEPTVRIVFQHKGLPCCLLLSLRFIFRGCVQSFPPCCLPALTQPPPNHYLLPHLGKSYEGPLIFIPTITPVTEMQLTDLYNLMTLFWGVGRERILICSEIILWHRLCLQVQISCLCQGPLWPLYGLCSLCAPYIITPMLFYPFAVSRFPPMTLQRPAGACLCGNLGKHGGRQRQFSC